MLVSLEGCGRTRRCGYPSDFPHGALDLFPYIFRDDDGSIDRLLFEEVGDAPRLFLEWEYFTL